MADHCFCVEWRFVVPPDNTHRVVITQRKDGPFRPDDVGGSGYYYTGVEAITPDYGGGWSHVPGSANGGLRSLQEAMRSAESKWRAAMPMPIGGPA